MGIVLPVVMAGLSLALFSAAHARNTAQAASLGEAKLMELVTTGQWGISATSGDFGNEWPGYKWSAQTASRDFGASEILLQVTWMEKGMQQSLSISTIVYDSGTTQGTTQGTTS